MVLLPVKSKQGSKVVDSKLKLGLLFMVYDHDHDSPLDYLGVFTLHFQWSLKIEYDFMPLLMVIGGLRFTHVHHLSHVWFPRNIYVPIKQIIETMKRRPSFNLESTTLDPCLLLTGSSTIF
jgi:hypothetical protein